MLLCSRGEEERAGGGGRNLQARFSFYSLLNAHPFQASVTCRQCSFCSTYGINTSKNSSSVLVGYSLPFILFCFVLGLILLVSWFGLFSSFVVLEEDFFVWLGFFAGGGFVCFFKLRFQMGHSSCGL